MSCLIALRMSWKTIHVCDFIAILSLFEWLRQYENRARPILTTRTARPIIRTARNSVLIAFISDSFCLSCRNPTTHHTGSINTMSECRGAQSKPLHRHTSFLDSDWLLSRRFFSCLNSGGDQNGYKYLLCSPRLSRMSYRWLLIGHMSNLVQEYGTRQVRHRPGKVPRICFAS